jgi:murein DD-endopeptidase MepM/ murein hydrolase activator NlpD
VIVFTPVGTWIPIPNPELENKYGRDLLALGQRMESLSEQIVELSAYNVKLRKALGERVVATDTGFVFAGPSRQSSDKSTALSRTPPSRNAARFEEPLLRDVQRSSMVPGGLQEMSRISFPAILPTEGYVTRGFVPEERHFGLDIAGKIGTPIHAAADGHVVFSGWTHEDGYVMIILHSGGFLTFYKHNQSLMKSTGMYARRGDPIALLGNSGQASSGPHLHFEIWKDGTPVDPSRYLLNLNF